MTHDGEWSLKPLVIYHANCPDGWTAAWVAARALGEVDLFPGKYGEDPPYELARGREVYVVDFSYPREQLEQLFQAAHSDWVASQNGHPLLVLDHHRTAQAALEGLHYCRFDMERSGAGMAWDYFHPGVARPWIVDYVEDRDLWRFALPWSREISLFIRTAPYTLESWDEMARMEVDDACGVALGCKRYLDHYVQDALRNAYEITHWWSHPDEPDDFKALRPAKLVCVNLCYTGVSDVLNAALEHFPSAEIALGWHLAADGKLNCSIRSRPDFDCSAFARFYGGGGHAQAAGFRRDRDHPFAIHLLEGADPKESA